MILSEIYQMHDRLCAVVLDPESGTLTPIRVVNLDTKELTPQFFSDARAGFPDAKPFRPYNPNSLNWLIIEKYGLLVASINNLGGFIVFESPDMIPLTKSLFSKKARLNYERFFPQRNTRSPCIRSTTGAGLRSQRLKRRVLKSQSIMASVASRLAATKSIRRTRAMRISLCMALVIIWTNSQEYKCRSSRKKHRSAATERSNMNYVRSIP